MTHKSYFQLFTSLLAITLLFTQCKKGDTGPAGPAGANGAQGATGSTGAQGPKGDTGTANVIYSNWLDVIYAPDTIHTGNIIDTIGFFANITAAKLSLAILNGGEMKVYINFGTSAAPDVAPLPYVDLFFGITITPEFLLQRIFLYSNANASTVTQGGSKFLQYRYILIPGGVSARISKQVDWNNYDQVKGYLGLKD